MKVDQPGSNVTASRGRPSWNGCPLLFSGDVINANFPGEPGVGLVVCHACPVLLSMTHICHPSPVLTTEKTFAENTLAEQQQQYQQEQPAGEIFARVVAGFHTRI